MVEAPQQIASLPVNQVAVAPDVFTMPPDEPRLIGSTCGECGATTFPVCLSCPRCGSRRWTAGPPAAAGHVDHMDDTSLPA